VAEELCRFFVSHGHDVLVQTSGFKDLRKHERRNGYDLYRSRAPRKKLDRCSYREMALYVCANVIPALRHALAWKPDIIHCHFAVPTGAVAWLVSALTGIPYVITAHLGDVPGGVPGQTDAVFRIVKPLTRPIWNNAAALTAVSAHVAELAESAYGRDVHIINNGIELDRKHSRQIICNDPVRLIFAGRFNPQKNLLFLMTTLGNCMDIQWTLELVGDGEQMPLVKDTISRLGLRNRVVVHGWLEPDRADAIMAQCDILVLPSLYEGMPVVGVKALQFGLAIAASDIKGLVGVVANGENGYVFPVNDGNAFQSVLKSMIVNKQMLKSMRKKSLDLVAAFDVSKIASHYESVFQKVLG
jgi:glycosyltransferase involved in cell wall biosynthesis